MSIEKVNNYIKKFELPITKNRRRVLLCLVDGVHFHSINDIIEHNKDMNVKSVYNAISDFLKKGAIDSYSFSGITKYAMPDSFFGNSDYSVHLVNQNDQVEHLEIESAIFEKIKSNAEEKGKKVTNIKIFVHTE